MMGRNRWNITAIFYGVARRLPLMGSILRQEISNLKSLTHNIDPHAGRILDIGTGIGSTLSVLPEAQVTICVDRSLAMLKRVSGKENIYSVVADALHLPFRDDTFPMISAIGITEYLHEKEALIKEVSRVSGKMAYLLVSITQPNITSFLRRCLGHKMFTISPEKWDTLVNKHKWVNKDRMKSLMQRQYIYQQIEEV